jgi:hypothetical protein
MTSSASPHWTSLRASVYAPSITSSLEVRPPSPHMPQLPYSSTNIILAVGHTVNPRLAPHIRACGRPIWYITLQSSTTLVRVGTQLQILFMDEECRVERVAVKRFWQQDEEHTVIECHVHNDINALLVLLSHKAHVQRPTWQKKIWNWFTCMDNQIYFTE